MPNTPFQMSKMINVSLSVSEVHFEEDSGCHSLDHDDFVFDVEGMIMSLPLHLSSLPHHTDPWRRHVAFVQGVCMLAHLLHVSSTFSGIFKIRLKVKDKLRSSRSHN